MSFDGAVISVPSSRREPLSGRSKPPMSLKADKDEYVDMSVTRRKIEVPTVEYSMLDDKIGRIAVSEFDVITVEQFEQAVDELQKDGMEGLIIDLRSNPGGVLDSAVKMVDYILPDDLDQYEKVYAVL